MDMTKVNQDLNELLYQKVHLEVAHMMIQFP